MNEEVSSYTQLAGRSFMQSVDSRMSNRVAKLAVMHVRMQHVDHVSISQQHVQNVVAGLRFHLSQSQIVLFTAAIASHA